MQSTLLYNGELIETAERLHELLKEHYCLESCKIIFYYKKNLFTIPMELSLADTLIDFVEFENPEEAWDILTVEYSGDIFGNSDFSEEKAEIRQKIISAENFDPKKYYSEFYSRLLKRMNEFFQENDFETGMYIESLPNSGWKCLFIHYENYE